MSWRFLFTLPLLAVNLVWAQPEPGALQAKGIEQQLEEENHYVLQRHYPFYAAYGNNQIKMQVSFKMPIVKTWPLYIGYTQLMFYQFGNHTKSFSDFTFDPELFYRQKIKSEVLKSIDFGIFDHASNGKPLPDHRSYNKAYLRLNAETQSVNWLVRYYVQLQGLYAFETSNQDIQNYIGPLGFGVTFVELFTSWFDKGEFDLEAFPGGKWADRWDRGGYQAGWSFRLGNVNVVPAFYVQYYIGYAESLLNYNQSVNQIKFGIVL